MVVAAVGEGPTTMPMQRQALGERGGDWMCATTNAATRSTATAMTEDPTPTSRCAITAQTARTVGRGQAIQTTTTVITTSSFARLARTSLHCPAAFATPNASRTLSAAMTVDPMPPRQIVRWALTVETVA